MENTEKKIKFMKILFWVNAVLLSAQIIFLVMSTKATDIFAEIDNENSLKLEMIIKTNPRMLEIKRKDLSGYDYNVPLHYAINREMPNKKIVLKLLKPTIEYYKKNEKNTELNIILCNVFRLSLEKAYELNPATFKDCPDFEVPDKILESGFDIHYKMNESYGGIEKLPSEIENKSTLKRATIKEYLKSKNIQCESSVVP